MCVKLYYLGRANVFSSVATDFGSWTTWFFRTFSIQIVKNMRVAFLDVCVCVSFF